MLAETPPPPGDGAPLRDPEWFALAWYGQTIERVCRVKGLVPLGPGDLASGPLAALPGRASGHLVAATSGLLELKAVDASWVVAGGPCIGDCTQFPTLEALYDTVQPLLAARALGIPAVLFLGDQEEMLERGGPGRWGKLAERFEGWIRGLAATCGAAPLAVVRTSSPAHRQAIDAELADLAGIDPERLDRAFHLAAGAPRPQGELAREVARRVIAAHLPRVVGRHLPALAKVPAVLMAENLQQAGVFQVACEVAASQGRRMEMAAHWPAPGLTGGERMFRSGSHDKAPAWELERVAAGEQSGVHPYTAEFFSRWLDRGLRAELAERAREAWEHPAAF